MRCSHIVPLGGEIWLDLWLLPMTWRDRGRLMALELMLIVLQCRMVQLYFGRLKFVIDGWNGSLSCLGDYGCGCRCCELLFFQRHDVSVLMLFLIDLHWY